MSATVYIVPKKQADNAYIFIGNQTSKNTLRIYNIRCVELRSNIDDCYRNFESSYIFLEHLTDDGCIMKFDEKKSEIKTFHYLFLNPYSKTMNLICTIDKIYDDTSNDYNQNQITGTSLFNIIFFGVCIVLIFGLCIGWCTLIYYRQFKQNRIEKRQQKELKICVQKYLDKSPIIIFNSNHDFIDDDLICAICLESFINNEKLRKLICSHYFHITCIDPWLLAHPNCPLCNQNILNDFIPSISAHITSTENEQNNDRESQSTNIPVAVNHTHTSIIVSEN